MEHKSSKPFCLGRPRSCPASPFVQKAPAFLDREASLARPRPLNRGSSRSGAASSSFPEVWLSGYPLLGRRPWIVQLHNGREGRIRFRTAAIVPPQAKNTNGWLQPRAKLEPTFVGGLQTRGFSAPRVHDLQRRCSFSTADCPTDGSVTARPIQLVTERNVLGSGLRLIFGVFDYDIGRALGGFLIFAANTS